MPSTPFYSFHTALRRHYKQQGYMRQQKSYGLLILLTFGIAHPESLRHKEPPPSSTLFVELVPTPITQRDTRHRVALLPSTSATTLRGLPISALS